MPVLRAPGFTGEVYGIYHGAEALSRVLTPQQKSPATFQEESNILNICPRKVVQTDFEHVQNDVRRHHMEFCQVREENDILRKVRSHSGIIEIMAYLQPHFRQFFDDILFPLQITELFIQLSNELRTRR